MTANERWIREKTVNKELCASCGGRCCKTCGCAYFSSDLDMSFANILEKLKNREISLDILQYKDSFYKVLDPPIYYLRVANVEEINPLQPKMGRCRLLVDEACSLDYDKRPTGGRLLVPFWSGCYPLYTTDEFINSWLPYQELLKSLIKELEKDY